MTCECIDVSQWIKSTDPPKGSRDKSWLVRKTSSGVELYLFKESHRRHPIEFWSEVITYHIGRLVGMPAPATSCARMGEKYGALIDFFLKQKDGQALERLDHGGDLILGTHPDFDRSKGERHNIVFAEEVFRKFNKPDLFSDFLRLLVFDALIGNTDRHQDNWGFISEGREIRRLTPAFDNSDSLGREIVDKKIPGLLAKNCERLKEYVRKGKPHLRWSEDGRDLEWIEHFQFLKRLSQKWPEVVEYVKIQTRFSDGDIDGILTPISRIPVENPLYALSAERLEFIKRIICLRRHMLKETFGV